ncbi:MAG: DUF1244 domain-containing protein [Rhodospirillales bacterium]|jgi:hypothetical protein|nr:DUF1244 domain-containing protein [Rhodospirillales bacterium]
MDDKTRTELEAAAFRGLRDHLRRRTDVQNIDLMNLSGFCRNCLSKWYVAAAEERGIDISYDESREIVYGMSYGEWKEKHQTEASDEQKRLYEETKPLHAKIAGHD